ncbi:YoaK family protein [Companilactobacillus sp. FL22-1]|uniref:YoaK family protein n=1 Tax=Companilactobacillus sp. FL22-1 TaxID=3373892 RepID=UPI0037550471
MKRFKSHKLFQLREIAIGLTFVGGFIDAYTFVQRGHVLAAGQTGNIVFLSVDIARQNLPGIVTKIMTMLFFCLGIIVVEFLKHKNNRSHYWRLTSLVAEFIICIVVGFLPKTVSNLYVVPPLAFVMAMQNISFDQIEGLGYNNVFSTGNLKKAIINFIEYFYHHRQGDITTSKIYFELVLGFSFGAIISALLQKWLFLRTIWIVPILLIIIGGYYTALVYRREN